MSGTESAAHSASLLHHCLQTDVSHPPWDRSNKEVSVSAVGTILKIRREKWQTKEG